MSPDACALVLPSSVHVSAPFTVLRDPKVRAAQYLECVTWFIRNSPVCRIIVCDNSGYRYPGYLAELAGNHGKRLELLSFTGDVGQVARYGKGYGEGEIMSYILEHSVLLGEVPGFLKITGRLKVPNLRQVLGRLDFSENYFMPVSLLRPRFLVPRAARPCVQVNVYYATRSFFTAVLLDAYKTVRDEQAYFLEHAYHDAMANAPYRPRCFPRIPEVTGVSGSNGWVLKERSFFVRWLVRIAAWLRYVKPV